MALLSEMGLVIIIGEDTGVTFYIGATGGGGDADEFCGLEVGKDPLVAFVCEVSFHCL